MAVKNSTYAMSEETKEKIRIARMGQKPTSETCRKISASLRGHEVNPLTREHISRGRMKV